MFTSMRYEPGRLSLLDQRLLPSKEYWIHCDRLEAVAESIEQMAVRGAPAIGCAAAFGLAIHLRAQPEKTAWREFLPEFQAGCDRLARTRPTAVNLFAAIEKATEVCARLPEGALVGDAAAALDQFAQDFFRADLQICHQIGKHGARLAKEHVNVLTHCNTGSLATGGYGTALGVIRSLHAHQKLGHLYVDETRPFLQGARLTAFELQQDTIPFTLIVDSAAGALMAQQKVDWVVVGADRIASNGDVANKIGTYSLAVLARYHGVCFYVAAPSTTLDARISSGAQIPIEDRPQQEVSHFLGNAIAPKGSEVANPAFDVTPAELITGIITEQGVLYPPYMDSLAKLEHQP